MVALLMATMGCPVAMAQVVLTSGAAPAGIPTTSSPPAPQTSVAQAGNPPTALSAPVQQPRTQPGGPGASPPIWIAPVTDDMLMCAPQPQERRIPLEASWDNGLRLESGDNQFHLHIGGLAMIDNVWLIGPQSRFAAVGGSSSNGAGNSEATQIRRAILQADGAIFDQFDYFVQFDFANASNENSGLQSASFSNLTSSPAPLNVWMQVRDVPYLGNVRVGNQVKTIGMDNNTGAAFLPFMERSDNMDAFYGPFDNGFALGIAAQNWSESERLTWRYGIFQPATNVFGVALNHYTAGARVTGLPWYANEGQRLIHLGLGYWGGEIVQNQLRDRARTLLRNAPGFDVPVLVDTSQVTGSKQYTLAPELAMVLGSFTLQAEYAAQWLVGAVDSNGVDQGTVFYHGGYVEALYFLTGEHQDYERREGVFGRVVPAENVHWKKGDSYRACGAWQIGVRFSFLDLNDKAIKGGQIYDWTVGLNWYLNPNMKAQLNYVAEHRGETPGVPTGWINGVGLRVAYDF